MGAITIDIRVRAYDIHEAFKIACWSSLVGALLVIREIDFILCIFFPMINGYDVFVFFIWEQGH